MKNTNNLNFFTNLTVKYDVFSNAVFKISFTNIMKTMRENLKMVNLMELENISIQTLVTMKVNG